MSTKEQIVVLDREFVETTATMSACVLVRDWSGFREAADHAMRVTSCIEALEAQGRIVRVGEAFAGKGKVAA